jgi:hypothetical protein
VQLAGRIADLLEQAAFDIHVDVIQLVLELEIAAVYLSEDGRQTAFDLSELGPGYDLLAGQHFGMRQAALDVMPVKAPIEGDRRQVALYLAVDLLLEPAP